MKVMEFGSLFTGLGGFDLGLEQAGMRCAWQCEIDPVCNRVLQRHWPKVRRYKDVRRVKGAKLSAVDLVCGGFPCQDLSVAGNRAGLSGERSGLWWEFHRVLAEVRPQWCLIENVPGLLSSYSPVEPPPGNVPVGGRWEVEETSDLAVILSGLEELGYGWAYRVLDAQYDGVAQRRERVFIVGCLGDGARAAEVLFEPESSIGDTPPRRETGAQVAATVSGSSPSRRNGGSYPTDGHMIAIPLTAHPHRDGNGDTNYVVARPLKSGGNDRHDESHDTYVVATLRSNGEAHSGFSDEKGLVIPFDTTQITSKGNYSAPKPGDPSHPLASGAHPPAVALKTAQTGSNGIGISEDVAYTLDSAQGQAVSLSLGVRRLTPLECERLQGFPDSWTEGESDSARYKMLGNAVCVPVAAWIAQRIVARHTQGAKVRRGEAPSSL